MIRDPVELKSVSLYEFFFNCSIFQETHGVLAFRSVKYLKILNFLSVYYFFVSCFPKKIVISEVLCI